MDHHDHFPPKIATLTTATLFRLRTLSGRIELCVARFYAVLFKHKFCCLWSQASSGWRVPMIVALKSCHSHYWTSALIYGAICYWYSIVLCSHRGWKVTVSGPCMKTFSSCEADRLQPLLPLGRMFAHALIVNLANSWFLGHPVS